jgi:hypothetical protein
MSVVDSSEAFMVHGPIKYGPVVRYGTDNDLGVCLSWPGGIEEVWWPDGYSDPISPAGPDSWHLEGHNAQAHVEPEKQGDAAILLLQAFGASRDYCYGFCPKTVRVLIHAARLSVQ